MSRRRWCIAMAIAATVLTTPAGASAAATCTQQLTTVTCRFAATGAADIWTVPAGVTSAKFELIGAPGHTASGFAVGPGGFTQAVMPVVGGQRIQVMVGMTADGVNPAGGFNGGGFPDGGGATDVRVGACAATASCPLSARILVAGGGGGGNSGLLVSGADGGGAAGEDGASNGAPGTGGHGGTQTAGGKGGTTVTGETDGQDGVAGRGGDGGRFGGSGGGGGYFGGGGGAGGAAGGPAGAGGGGSGFVSTDPALGLTQASTSRGNFGDYHFQPPGGVTISYNIGSGPLTPTDAYGNWLGIWDYSVDGATTTLRPAPCVTAGQALQHPYAMLRLPYQGSNPPRYTDGIAWVDYFGLPFAATPPVTFGDIPFDQLRPYAGGPARGGDLDLAILPFLPQGTYTVHVLLWNASLQIGHLQASTQVGPFTVECSALGTATATALAARTAARPSQHVRRGRLQVARQRARVAAADLTGSLRVAGSKRSSNKVTMRRRGGKTIVTISNGHGRRTIAVR